MLCCFNLFIISVYIDILATRRRCRHAITTKMKIFANIIYGFPCVSTDSTVGVQEDRKKVPWSDKETIILLEIWGDIQVDVIMEVLQFSSCDFRGLKLVFT